MPAPQHAAVEIFQAWLNEAQRRRVSPLCTALPIDPSAADAREYEQFRALHALRQAPPAAFWGLLSWRFELKAPVPMAEFVAFAQQAQAAGLDGCVLNPMLANEALFLHGWEQARYCGQGGMAPVAGFLAAREPGLLLPEDRRVTAYCNYFAGNQAFWQGYFAHVERLLAPLEQEKAAGSAVGLAYAGSGGYARDAGVTLRPFVIERLLASFLRAPHGLRVASFGYEERHYRAKLGANYGPLCWALSETKRQALAANDAALLQRWDARRQAVLAACGPTLLQLDDPAALCWE